MIQLPDITTDAGVLCRLIIAECESPGYSDYNESDGQLSFRLMQAVVSNRLNNNPAQFGAPGATNLTDIITAPNQFEGFSTSDGQVHLSQSVSDRIDAVMAKANAGSPGSYYQFVLDIINRVNGAVNDPLAGLTSINGTAVQGGTYGWRTAGSGDPGGLFFPVPPALGGVLLGNQFYTLLPAHVDLGQTEEPSLSFRARFRDGSSFSNFLTVAADASSHTLHGFVKRGEKDGFILFSPIPDSAAWTEVKIGDIRQIEYYGMEIHNRVVCARVRLALSASNNTSSILQKSAARHRKGAAAVAKGSRKGKVGPSDGR